MDAARSARRLQMSATDWVLRGVPAVNFTLFLLSFIPAFSGIGPEPGVADRLWGNYRLAGWRADVVWMCASTVIIGTGSLRSTSERGPRRMTSIICRVWLACFVVYLSYTLLHMLG